MKKIDKIGGTTNNTQFADQVNAIATKKVKFKVRETINEGVLGDSLSNPGTIYFSKEGIMLGGYIFGETVDPELWASKSEVTKLSNRVNNLFGKAHALKFAGIINSDGNVEKFFTSAVEADITGDGIIDNQDSEEINRILPTGEYSSAADVNGDGLIDTQDVTMVNVAMQNDIFPFANIVKIVSIQAGWTFFSQYTGTLCGVPVQYGDMIILTRSIAKDTTRTLSSDDFVVNSTKVGIASEDANGLMTSAMVVKLNSIEEGATKNEIATSSTAGLVKVDTASSDNETGIYLNDDGKLAFKGGIYVGITEGENAGATLMLQSVSGVEFPQDLTNATIPVANNKLGLVKIAPNSGLIIDAETGAIKVDEEHITANFVWS